MLIQQVVDIFSEIFTMKFATMHPIIQTQIMLYSNCMTLANCFIHTLHGYFADNEAFVPLHCETTQTI